MKFPLKLVCLSLLITGAAFGQINYGQVGPQIYPVGIPAMGTGLIGGKGSAIYVSTNGLDSNPGTLVAPKLTISNACFYAGSNGYVYAAKGNYIESDILFNGTIKFEPGSFLDYDSINGTTSSIFTDHPKVGPVVTNINLTILGGVGLTNLHNNFCLAFYCEGSNSFVNAELGDVVSDPNDGAWIIFDPSSYPDRFNYTPPPYTDRLRITANTISGEMWIGECSAAVTAYQYFTNTYFFLDRDTTNFSPPVTITAPYARNCQVVCQRPYNSQAVFNVNTWYGGPISVAVNNNGPPSAMVSCIYGNCVFNNCNFIQYTNNASASLFYLTSSFAGYAQTDTNHAGNLILNNCTVTSFPSNTNLLFTTVIDSHTAVGIKPRVSIGGTLAACYVSYVNTLQLDGSGTIVTNGTWLTNYFNYQKTP